MKEEVTLGLICEGLSLPVYTIVMLSITMRIQESGFFKAMPWGLLALPWVLIVFMLIPLYILMWLEK